MVRECKEIKEFKEFFWGGLFVSKFLNFLIFLNFLSWKLLRYAFDKPPFLSFMPTLHYCIEADLE